MKHHREQLRRALQEMERTRKALLAGIAPLSQAQLDFRPARDRWSAGEAAHHAGLAEEVQIGFVRRLLQAGGEQRQASRSISFQELPLRPAMVPASLLQLPFVLLPVSLMTAVVPRAVQQVLFANPLLKARTVPRMEPQHGIGRARLLELLREIRERTLAILAPVEDWDLSRFQYSHPLLGSQDVYSVLGLLAAHDERHTRQIADIRHHPGFPA